jgi:integrase
LQIIRRLSWSKEKIVTIQNLTQTYEGWDDDPRPHDEEMREAQAIAARKSPITLRGYTYDFGVFSRWCVERGAQPLPASPNTVAEFLRYKSTQCAPGKDSLYAYNTLVRWVTAVDHYHALNVHRLPGRSKVVNSALRDAAHTNPQGKEREAFTTDDIIRIIDSMDFRTWPRSVKNYRDAAMILVGFGGGYRRKEIGRFVRRDIKFGADGVAIRLPRSKTDQIGVGRIGGVFRSAQPRYCAPCALARWMMLTNAYGKGHSNLDEVASELAAGRDAKHICTKKLKFRALAPGSPVFASLSPSSKLTTHQMQLSAINLAIQQHAVPLGYPASQYGTHSLRAGFVTTALDNGATVEEIMRQTGHKSAEMVLRYYRNRRPLTLNAGRLVLVDKKAKSSNKDHTAASAAGNSKKTKGDKETKTKKKNQHEAQHPPKRSKKRKTQPKSRKAQQGKH